MWFKNTTVYRLPDGAPSKADLADALLDLPFAPCLRIPSQFDKFGFRRFSIYDFPIA